MRAAAQSLVDSREGALDLITQMPFAGAVLDKDRAVHRAGVTGLGEIGVPGFAAPTCGYANCRSGPKCSVRC